MSETEPAATASRNAKFVSGSTLRHVLVMTATSSVGLTALFLVDFADLYFLSLLGEREVAGAIGYAGSVIYFNISICVGLTIAVAALVARAIGARREAEAQRLAASAVLYALLFTLMVTVVLWFSIDAILELLGAGEDAFGYGRAYARITVLSLPLLAIGMCCNGMLRALGDARLAMYTLLAGGIVNAVLDPILIFWLDMGVEGAALASVCARAMIVAVGLYGTVSVHRFLVMPRLAWLRRDAAAITKIAAPAMLTNIANPFALAYVTATLSAFGDDAVAATAVINRIVPLAFGVLFSLSGALGPIIGQNYGAQRLDRARRSYMDALVFAGLYAVAVSLLLLVFRGEVAALFNASAGAAALIGLFCSFVSFTWAFGGIQFVANASFNNLGKAHWSTLFNWAKATVGTIPFVYAGAAWAGAAGALVGMGIGSAVFGIAAGTVGYRLLTRMEQRQATQSA